VHMSASLIGRLGSSAFRLSNVAVSMSLAGFSWKRFLRNWRRPKAPRSLFKREVGGKIRVASMLWEDARMILRDEVLIVRNVDGRLRVAEAPAPQRLGPPVES
jgi:hypothetical protein